MVRDMLDKSRALKILSILQSQTPDPCPLPFPASSRPSLEVHGGNIVATNSWLAVVKGRASEIQMSTVIPLEFLRWSRIP